MIASRTAGPVVKAVPIRSAHAAAFEFEAEFEVEEFLEDEARLCAGVVEDISSSMGVPASGKWTARRAARREGKLRRASIAGGRVSVTGAEFVDPTHDGEAVMDGAPGIGAGAGLGNHGTWWR